MKLKHSICYGLHTKYLLLGLIILLAGFCRFYHLGQNPASLNWDEASLGYNTYSLYKTGKDEFGQFLPINLRSFDDYKPALYSYLSILPVAALGLTEFSIRFISALAGTLTVLVIYLLTEELFNSNRAGIGKTCHLSLITSFLLAISPWHLQFSRGAFEANLGLFWFSLGAYFLISFLKSRPAQLKYAAVSFVLAMYSYHSFRLIVPIFLVVVLVKNFKFFYHRRLVWLKALVVGFIIGLPLILSFFKQGGEARFGAVTTLKPTGTLDRSIRLIEQDQQRGSWLTVLHNRRLVYGLTFIKGYLDHFSVNFLFLVGDHSLRHHLNYQGMLYWFQLPLIVIALIYLLKAMTKNSYYLFSWLLLAPLASALTSGTPHAIRAILMVIPLTVFSGLGLYRLAVKLKNHKLLFLGCGLILAVFVGRYFIQYHYIYPKQSAYDWQYGFKQVYEFLQQDNPTNKKVIVTYVYDQPQAFFQFYYLPEPGLYQQECAQNPIDRFERSCLNFEFRKINWSQDQSLQDVYLVAAPNELPNQVKEVVKQIDFPNGEVAFKIIKL